jgi:glycosyltransferase involved in cell wall biosynthesis
VTDDVVRSFPALVHATDQPLAGVARALNTSVLAYRKAFFSRAAVSLAFSEAARAFLVRSGVRPEQVVRTYEVIPAGLLPPARDDHARDGRTFLYVGYLTERKNVSLLINAFRDLAEPLAGLVIAGVGPEEAMLRELAAGDERISFVGYLDEQQKAEHYAAADVLVLPTRHDCWGLVVNEAVHYGLAIVVTDTAAASELIDDSRGVVIASADQQALTGAMARLIREPGMLRAMQEHNRGDAAVSDVAAAVRGLSQAIAEAAT